MPVAGWAYEGLGLEALANWIAQTMRPMRSTAGLDALVGSQLE